MVLSIACAAFILLQRALWSCYSRTSAAGDEVAVAVILCGIAFAAEQTMKKSPEAKGGAFAAVGFMACSGCLLLVNKIAVFHLQMPTTMVCLQLAFTAVVIGGLGHGAWRSQVPLVRQRKLGVPQILCAGALSFTAFHYIEGS